MKAMGDSPWNCVCDRHSIVSLPALVTVLGQQSGLLSSISTQGVGRKGEEYPGRGCTTSKGKTGVWAKNQTLS